MQPMDTEGWIRVCATSELLPGEMQMAWDGDTPILVFNHDGDLYALEDRCSHEDFELSAGAFDPATGTIECVLHGAKFADRCVGGQAAIKRPMRSIRISWSKGFRNRSSAPKLRTIS